MIYFSIVILVVSISVSFHPFPHLMSWKRLLTYYNIDYPIINAAIPNGSHGWRWGCCLKARPPPK